MLQPRRAELCLPSTGLLLLLSLCAAVPVQAQQSAAIRGVKVLGSKDAVEIEIEASERVVPQTRVLTGPDRLVVDFPNAVPSAQLRSQSVNRGEVTDVRVGLFQSHPPVTRVVLDLKAPQSYQVFPYGRTVMIKVTGSAPAPADTAAGVEDFPPEPATRPGLVNANFAKPLALETGPSTKPSLDVSFHNGLLTIRANKASLSEVLFTVHQRTGAEVAIAAGAEQEQVAADIGPAPAAEVIAQLLNGSRFNFLIVNSASDPRQLDRVILTPRGEGGIAPQSAVQSGDDADETPEPAARSASQPMPVQQPPIPQPEVKAADDNTPD
jgi:AMIN domain-containing protein